MKALRCLRDSRFIRLWVIPVNLPCMALYVNGRLLRPLLDRGPSPDADQALGGVDEHPATGHCRRAMRYLAQRVSCQDLEPVRGFHHHHLAFGRDAKQPAVHPEGRTEKTAAHTLLPFHLTQGGLHATDDSAVAPQEEPFSHTDARRHVRGRL